VSLRRHHPNKWGAKANSMLVRIPDQRNGWPFGGTHRLMTAVAQAGSAAQVAVDPASAGSVAAEAYPTAVSAGWWA
jgi:hypothetical protein